MAICTLTGLWAVQTAYAASSQQVLLCCLTLVDPLVAIAGGALVQQETTAISALAVVGAVGFGALAVTAVVVLAGDHPVSFSAPTDLDHLDDITTSRR